MTNKARTRQIKMKFLQQQLDGMTEARDRFCHSIGEIARALGMQERDAYAPEAVLRRAKLVMQQLDQKQSIIDSLPGPSMLWKCPDCGFFAKVNCICPNPECRLNHPMQSKNVIGQCKCGGAVSMKDEMLDCNRCGIAACLPITDEYEAVNKNGAGN